MQTRILSFLQRRCHLQLKDSWSIPSSHTTVQLYLIVCRLKYWHTVLSIGSVQRFRSILILFTRRWRAFWIAQGGRKAMIHRQRRMEILVQPKPTNRHFESWTLIYSIVRPSPADRTKPPVLLQATSIPTQRIYSIWDQINLCQIVHWRCLV